MYSEIIDLIPSTFELTLLHLIYDILANEVDNAIWLAEQDFS